MEVNLSQYRAFSHEVCLDPMQSSPWSPGVSLSEGRTSRSESQLTDNWQERDNTERSQVEEDRELHQLMEDIKNYIRSIDIGNL